MEPKKNYILTLLNKLIGFLYIRKEQVSELSSATRRSRKLYRVAAKSIGKDVSPFDIYEDDVSCAISLSKILQKVISFPDIPGTYTMVNHFERDSRFIEITGQEQPGDIIICATGTGNGSMRGHVGILAHNGLIMSVSSQTGTWEINYTVDSWQQRYVLNGGMAIRIFRLL